MPLITNIIVVNSQFVIKIVKYYLILCKTTSTTIYVTNTNMTATLAHFTLFLQNEEKVINEVKITAGLVTLRAAAIRKES